VFWCSSDAKSAARKDLHAKSAHLVISALPQGEKKVALKLVEIYAKKEDTPRLNAILADHKTLECWEDNLREERVVVRVLLNEEDVQGLLDSLTQQFGRVEGFRVLLVPVVGAVPLSGASWGGERASREELVLAVQEVASGGRWFFVLVALSSVVATIGLMRDSVAVVIGAMVIAPLLGPNMALALGTVLGEGRLIRRAALALVSGLLLAFGVAILCALMMGKAVWGQELETRAVLQLSDVLVALAAGVAGALAFSRRAATALVGVMVAVALLPPLAATAIFLTAGDQHKATGAALLLAVNIVSVNLASILTFRLQGLKPTLWWRAEYAKRTTLFATLIWGVLLGALLALLLFLR